MSAPAGYVRAVGLHEPVVIDPELRRAAARRCQQNAIDDADLALLLEVVGLTREDVEQP